MDKSKDNKRIIEVVPHDPEWKQMYEKEASKLRNIFKNVINIYHIGSTSIKNIKAKPIIDILIEVSDITEVDNYNEDMKKIGYFPKGEYGIPGRRYFRKGVPQHTHHAHVFEIGNEEINRHLNFRDYLNAHPKEAEEYSLLKEKLAKKYRCDSDGYTNGKNNFIKKIDQRARIWSDKYS